ncbi:MAG TPA: hypothetical protein PK669_06730 [Methanosarcina thermophila]|nr:hypothetical protein [Methanosarcina thermophila]HOA68663.1 hypothetical protein [Methanosarcina thermophila]HOQ65225.1 hypothetical protein [Methanosarcina thermophila]HPT80736.1 hypothetical protein [Methanosarcina thermophila]HPZ20013.1 hypothetical protein [Methanosarcina thermophila]HQD94381.1 hypothetical protein [Methanosarcina thermophila]
MRTMQEAPLPSGKKQVQRLLCTAWMQTKFAKEGRGEATSYWNYGKDSWALFRSGSTLQIPGF